MLGELIGAGIQVGAAAYGAYENYEIGRQMSDTQNNIYQLNQQAQVQQRHAMILAAHRNQLEVVRNNQRARALALNTSTGQGAQQGSGLQGAYGQISGASETNLLGINQNLAIGLRLSDINSKISTQNYQYSLEKQALATAQGWASLASNVGGAVTNVSKGFGGSTPATPTAPAPAWSQPDDFGGE